LADQGKARARPQKITGGKLQPAKTGEMRANELVDTTIAMLSELSPEPETSGPCPGNAWQEIILQVQGESGTISGYSRSLVCKTMRQVTEQLSVFSLMALWLVTDQGRSWKGNGKSSRLHLQLPPVDPDDVISFLTEILFSRAEVDRLHRNLDAREN
jgi:hypothetical protein